jgi:phosphate transport system substrate-binding protein
MKRALAFAAACCASLAVLAQEAAPYRAPQSVTGTIRIWGHGAMNAVVANWAEGFARFHPGAKIEAKLMGSDTAMPGLYSGNADIALLGRESNITDDNGFLRPKQYAPTRYELMNGSLDADEQAAALVVFVHRDNPLARLTLAQLDALFGCERRRGLANIRAWGDLGLTGEWAGKPIHLYGFDAATGTGQFFQRVVMRDSRKMNWEEMHEYRSAREIADAMRGDRYAIGVSTLRYANAGLKALALAADERGPYVEAAKETVIARTYPLARRTYAFVDQPPGMPLDPAVKEFLRYALSREGQADVARAGDYLPLSHDVLDRQTAQLGTVSASERVTSQPIAQPALRFVDELPLYRPRDKVAGTVTLWGHGSFRRDFMGKLVNRWIATFQRGQPDVKFEYRMYGTASAIGALYTGAGNVAILGEEISPDAAAAFRRAKGYAPTGIEIATGSLDVNFFDYAHMVFVHRDNPLKAITVAQLEAIFGTEHARGPRNIRTWGEAGIGGEWAGRRIRPYGWKVDEDFALFFREAVLADSHRWNPEVKEYVHVTRADGTQYDHGAQILDALARDRDGIAISNVRYANPDVRALAIAAEPDAPAYAPTHASLIAQDYALTRIIPAFIDVPPGGAPEPAVREFLRFVLSREGQQALLEESGYLPLGTEAIRKQLVKLPPAATVASGPAAPVPAPGTLRIWGTPEMKPIAQRWAEAFRKRHPGARVELRMTGSDIGMAGLYTGRADVALLGRDATANEVKAFEWVYRYKPARVAVMNGSLQRPGRSPALAAFVHRDNPLSRITLAELDALFGEERLRGAGRAIRTWGDLGLAGDRAGKPVHLYTFDTESGTGRFFRNAVLGGSRKLHWETLEEFRDSAPLGNPSHDASRKIIAALARDPYGLAVAGAGAGPGVKALKVAAGEGPGEAPTREGIVAGRYPLARAVYAYFNRKPDAAADAKVAEFLQYALSREGQQDVEAAEAYLPLNPETAREQLRQLQPGKGR